LRKVIEQRLKSKGVVTPVDDDEGETPENASTNVVDFMALLQKSLASNKRTPAKKGAVKKVAKTAPRKASAKVATAKPASGGKKKKPVRKGTSKASKRKAS
ncbi:MAG: Ku protein, partial [Casimicrobiaceae bacterium]